MAETNKVKFGLKNCYYAVLTETNGAVTYGTPVAFAGAVSLSLDPEGGEPEPFYADDMIYYQSAGSNNGYSGDFEVARVIDSFHTDVLGDLTDANGLMVEAADVPSKEFALMCEFKGDKHQTRHVLYRCRASRPAFGSATTEDTASPQTETLTITAIPQEFSTEVSGGATVTHTVVKAKATAADSATAYNAWFTQVQTPTFAAEA